MEVIRINATNLIHYQAQASPCIMAIGFFDGLHVGHRQVLLTAKNISIEKKLPFTVMSFFPHPKEVLSDGKVKVDYLMPFLEKKQMLETIGVDTFMIVEFTKDFASLSPEQFVANYLIKLGAVHVVAGFDFSYGDKGTGHMNRLKDDSKGLIEVTKVDKVESWGEKISSTSIRENLLKGNIGKLSRLLGRQYITECEWKGCTLKPKQYYMLPAPGCYSVTINNGKNRIETDVMVNEENQISIENVINTLVDFNSTISIVWHEKRVAVPH